MKRGMLTVRQRRRTKKPKPPEPKNVNLGGPLGYGWPFWQAYASNVLWCAALGVLFRFADFVAVLGGTEWHLGWIVGIGMIGSLAVRIWLGSCIDRYGTRIVWLGSLSLYAAVCFAHLWIDSCTGVTIYVMRIMLCSAWAGIFGASMTFVTKQGAENRMAELYGMLGTATFVGFFFGTQLSDLLLSFGPIDRASVNRLFVAAGVLTITAGPLAIAATRNDAHPRVAAVPSVWWLLRRYHPMTTFLVGAVMGMLVGLPYTFLRTYVAQLGISRIGLYFAICAATAVGVRIPTRQWPERFGNRAIILLGAGGMALSQLTFLLVRTEWQLAVPAAIFGATQAIMFPAVTAAGCSAFPARYRGFATTLSLGVGDFGVMIGSPLAGLVLSQAEKVGLPAYPTLFATMAVAMAVAAVVFAAAHRADR